MKKFPIITPDGYYRENEVANFLGLTIATLRGNHSRRKNMPPRTKIGQTIIYNKTSFHSWLENREEKKVVVTKSTKKGWSL